MLGILGTLISIFSPLLASLIKKIIDGGKIDAEQKNRLEDAYRALSALQQTDTIKTKELEKRLPDEQAKMDEIKKSGKWPWQT